MYMITAYQSLYHSVKFFCFWYGSDFMLNVLLTKCWHVEENCRARKENMAMEKAIAERLGYLQRYKVILQHFLQLSLVFHIVCISVIAFWSQCVNFLVTLAA